jgi:exopolyphosphatase/guanosine-5'-triphosphate,3'-diphosphate pyrophosphatase
MLKQLKEKDNNRLYKAITNKIPDRTTTITTGLMILESVIAKFHCKKLYISDYGVREGFLLNKIREM